MAFGSLAFGWPQPQTPVLPGSVPTPPGLMPFGAMQAPSYRSNAAPPPMVPELAEVDQVMQQGQDRPILNGIRSFAENLRSGPLSERIGQNRNALLGMGAALATPSGGVMGPNMGAFAANLSSGMQMDEQAAQQRQSDEALTALFQSPDFAALPESYRNLLMSDPELGRAFAMDMLSQQMAPQGTTDPTAAMQEYLFYAEQEQAAGREPLPFGEWDLERRGRGATQITNTVGGDSVPAGFEAVDREFAQDVYVPWLAAGGYADAQKQIEQLYDVLSELQGGANITGPIIGQTPDALLYLFNPEAVDARNRVEEVVQRNLREILGAQFTENEGTRLIERAFNPNLEGPENARRLAALITQMERAAQAKNEAVEYFRENGTLWGWQGTLPTIADFDAAIDAAAPSGQQGGAQSPVPVTTPADAEALPPGTLYVTPDGEVYRR